MRSKHLPQSHHGTGLAKEGFAAEVCGLPVLAPGGQDQKEFVTETSMKNALSSKFRLSNLDSLFECLAALRPGVFALKLPKIAEYSNPGLRDATPAGFGNHSRFW